MAYFETRRTKDGKTRYKAQIRLKGYPIQTATFTRLTDAKRWANQIESAILEGRHFKTSESKKRTVKELIERYEREILPTKPKSKQESQFAWWKKQIGSYLLSDVTPALIGVYRDKLANGITPQGKKRKNGTVLRYLTAISHAFTVAVREWGWLEESPMNKVRKPSPSRGRVRFLSDEERENLLKHCKASPNKFLFTVVIIALSTGMRKGEILSLAWKKNIDLEEGRITLLETKNNEIRRVPLKGLALQSLKKLRLDQPFRTGYLFPSKNEKRPIDIRSAWETAVKKAKISDFTFHDLRHCTGSYLAMNGATPSEIAEVLGHKTLQMVKRYSHLSEQHTASVVERMNDKIFSTEGTV